MRLLQAVLTAGLLWHLAATGPLPQDDDDYSSSNYYDDEDYDTTEEVDAALTNANPEPQGGAEPEVVPATAPEPSGGTVGVDVHSVTPVEKIPESCTQPPDTGICRGHFPMFYFDPTSRTCLPFVYGGCRGNENVYKTARECYEKCHPIGHTRGGGKVKEDFLTLHDGRNKYVFTFPGHDAAIRVDDASLADFSVRNVFQLEFIFRTDSPHGLIAFLRQTSVPPELHGKRVQLYVFLRRGHLGVTHTFCHNTETILMKKGGMQGGNWHSVLVKLDAGTGELLLEVDGHQEFFTITSLTDTPNYGARNATGFSPRLWIGGVFKEELEREGMLVGTSNFHGCLKRVGVMSGPTSEELVRHKALRSAEHRGVVEKCTTNCNDRYRNLCSSKAHCVEHFDHSTCNCFGTGKDGLRCTNPDIPVLSLNHDGHVVHRLYDWMDRAHSYNNLISLQFRTQFTDSILFYASAEHPERQYIGATLTASGRVYVEANLGGGAMGVEVGERLQTGTWHTLTLIHRHNRLQVHLNSRLYDTLVLPGEVRYFHPDPDFYLGSAPNLTRECGLRSERGTSEGFGCQGGNERYYYDVKTAACHTFNYTGCGGNDNRFLDLDTCMDTCHFPGLRSFHSFLGCMRNVYFNDASILFQLQQNNKTTRYYGMSKEAPVSTTCDEDKQMILLTLSTEKANVRLTNPNPDNFRIVASFKPSSPRGVLASGYVDVLDTRSEWEIHYDESQVSFVIHDNLVNIRFDSKVTSESWQYVDVQYTGGNMVMTLNQKTSSSKPPGPLTFMPFFTLGLSPLEEYPGMVGCVRKLEVGGEEVELRSLVGTSLAHKDVTYDGCKVLGPCERAGSCDHGTTCTVRDEELHCDCDGTGYTGKTCYFSLYKRSCEQYRQLGYDTPGVYKIDLDGNGPIPPSYVKCQFDRLTGETKTLVENNLPDQYEVRGPDLGDLQVQVQYRDFCPEMLRTLIDQSDSCTQKVRYDCRRSPLELSTHTWFSSPSDEHFSNFGSETPGLCRCRDLNVCAGENAACNCDVVDGLARFDEATMHNPRQLPITSMFFLQDHERLRQESEGLMTLGPLTCTKKATEEQTVSFSKSGSFLEVPAWREGSLSLSFKTTSRKAVVVYQPAYHPSHATFRIAIVGDKEVEFMYSFHGTLHRHSLLTTRQLNTGEWQQVLIDIHHHQLRLVVNSEHKIIDIEESANLGVLDGSMFLGGVPPRFLEDSDVGELGSLVGCIRGLALNEEMVDLARYIRGAPIGVSASCTPSCQPNPCMNGAKCIENWGTYQCVCKDPLAHSGPNCEINLNEDAVTFTTEESKLKYFVNDTATLQRDNLVNSSSFLLNFRTHAHDGLILFAYDYLHNFVQLYLTQGRQLAFLFNAGKEVKQLIVQAPDDVSLSAGQSVQVAVHRLAATTTVSVFTKGNFINASLDTGLLLLGEEGYEQFPFGKSTPLPEMVYYPHSATKPTPFFQVYLGSADDDQFDVRPPMKGFVGCIRGVKVDSDLVSLHNLVKKNEYSVEGVKLKCEMLCDQQPCLNGGLCTEDFLYPTNFHCDCSGTSYHGPVCGTETAYTFHGREWLSRAASVSPIMEDLVFELAFSASRRYPKPQLVALLRSTDTEAPRDYILVAVEPDGTVEVVTELQGSTRLAKVTPGADGVNAFSGHRHSVKVEWAAGALRVMIDREEREVRGTMLLRTTVGEVDTTPRGLYLGGLEEGLDDRFTQYDNFHGCISNVKVSNPAGTAKPLEEYSNNDKHVRNHGLPGYGSCAGFAALALPGIVMSYRNNLNVSAVMGEDWTYRTAQRTPFQAVPAAAPYTRDSRMDDVVPAVATCILLASIILLVCLFLWQRYKKRKAKKEAEKEEEERQLLLKKKDIARAGKTRVGVVSETEMKPLKSAPNGKATAQEEPASQRDVKMEDVPLTGSSPASPTDGTAKEGTEGDVVESGGGGNGGEEEAEVRTSMQKEPSLDRPLSWDKSTDRLPLIIGSVVKSQTTEEEAEDTDSAGSGLEYTLDIAGSPSAEFPPKPDLSVGDSSPSSTRVQRGSNAMLYIDEDLETDSESVPQLIRHASLPNEGHPEEVIEPLIVPKTSHQLTGDGEVQKIVKSEVEDEIIVVDDDMDDKGEASDKKETDNAEDVNEDLKSKEDSQEGQQETANDLAKEDLTEGATVAQPLESSDDDGTEPKTDQSFESAKEDHPDIKENGEPASEENGEHTSSSSSSESAADKGEEKDKPEEEGKEKEAKQTGDPEGKPKGAGEDGKSDDDFVELRLENDQVRDAHRITLQTWQDHEEDGKSPNKESDISENEREETLAFSQDNKRYPEEDQEEFQELEEVRQEQNANEAEDAEHESNKAASSPCTQEAETRDTQLDPPVIIISQAGEKRETGGGSQPYDQYKVDVVEQEKEKEEEEDEEEEEEEDQDARAPRAEDEVTSCLPSGERASTPEHGDQNYDNNNTDSERMVGGEDDENVDNAEPEEEGTQETWNSGSKVNTDTTENDEHKDEHSEEEDLYYDEVAGSDRQNTFPPIDISFELPSSPHDLCPGSPQSDGDTLESPTYLNYVQDDDICLEGFKLSAEDREVAKVGSVTPLDPISEQDESEDSDEGEKNREHLTPSLLRSKLSLGITNLSAISGDTTHNHSSSEDEPDGISASTGGDQPDPHTSPSSSSSSSAEPNTSSKKRPRKGHVTKDKQSPIFLSEGVRTFSNPVSYLGGPNIEYEEEEGRVRRDSVLSTSSLD